jgi:hypothetical protein
MTEFQYYSYCINPTEQEVLFPPGVILAIHLINSSNISKLMAMFWYLSACISLLV